MFYCCEQIRTLVHRLSVEEEVVQLPRRGGVQVAKPSVRESAMTAPVPKAFPDFHIVEAGDVSHEFRPQKGEVVH